MFLKQYELWQTCNNNCLFCFNKRNAGILNPEQQIKALNYVISDLDTVVKEHKDLSIELIGGDFFQGQLSTPQVRTLFFQLIHKLRDLSDKKLIKQVCLFVTLTLGDQADLYKTIEILQNPNRELWVSTSYDTYGRFITPERLNNWKLNMIKISSYTNLNINTTSILTADFVTKVLSGELDLAQFQKNYHTTLFFKHPLIMMDESVCACSHKDQRELYLAEKARVLKETPWFLPKRADVLKFMLYLNKLGILDRLMGLEYRADDLDAKFIDQGHFVKTLRDKEHNIESAGEAKNPCGHVLTYMCYSDSDKCLLCDRENILNDL